MIRAIVDYPIIYLCYQFDIFNLIYVEIKFEKVSIKLLHCVFDLVPNQTKNILGNRIQH